jgi:hypothetical protein
MGYNVELDFGGRTYRWENQDFSLTESFDFFNSSPPLRSVSLALKLEDDVSALVAKGYRLDASQCRVLDSDNDVQLTGICQNPVWGYPEEPIRFTVREVPFDTGSMFPGPYDIEQVTIDPVATLEARKESFIQQVLQTPWIRPSTYDIAVVVSKDLGTIPPIVIGHPGALTESNQNLIWEGAPAIYIDQTPGSETLLACCHRVSPVSGDLWVNGPSGTSDRRVWATVNYSASEDLSGRPITIVDLSATPPGVFDLQAVSDDWFCAFIGTGDVQVLGLPSQGGQLVKTFLNQCFGLRLDQNKLGEVISYLNGYSFDGYINEQVNPWEYLQEQVLSLLPVSAVNGPDGLYLAPWFPDAGAVDEIIEGRQVSIDGQVKYEKMKIVNNLTINYQYQDDSQTFRQIVEVNSTNNAYAELSQQLFGMQSKVIETPIVNDEATAQQIANWMIRAYSIPPRRVSLRVSSSRYQPRRVGDVVDVNLPSLSIAQRGIICEIERAGRPVMRIDVLLFDDVIRGIA